MDDKLDTGRENTGDRLTETSLAQRDLKVWFVHEVLPLEAALMQFLRRSGRGSADIADLRQEVYLRVCEMRKKKFRARSNHSFSPSRAIY